MNRTKFLATITLLIVATSVIGALLVTYLTENITVWKTVLLFAILVITQLISVALLRELFPPLYRVAIVGFPASGKTTLLTLIFQQIFAGTLPGLSAEPRGKTTADRVLADIKRLEIGESLGPTTDQDLFAYRTDIIRTNFFGYKRRYKVEIGDFPGEDSDGFTRGRGKPLFYETPFFRWVMEADAFVFVIDSTWTLIQDKNGDDKEAVNSYVEQMTQAFQIAWNKLKAYHTEGEADLPNKPLFLIFTKADLFNVTSSVATDDAVIKKLMQLGFGKPVPIEQITEIDKTAFEIGKRRITEELFHELISFFRQESRNFSSYETYDFVSCFSLMDGKRLGLPQLIDKILPK